MKNSLKLSLNDSQKILLHYTGYNQHTAILDEKANIKKNNHKLLISDKCSIHKSFKQDMVGTRKIGAYQEPSKNLLTSISNYLKSNQQAIKLIKERLSTLGFSAEESNQNVIDAYIFNFSYAFLCMPENKELNADSESKINIQSLNIINTLQSMNPETVAQISILGANVLSPLSFVIDSHQFITYLKQLLLSDETFLEKKGARPTSYIEINVTNNSINILIETTDSHYGSSFIINLDAGRKNATILSSNLELSQEFISDIDIQDFILQDPYKVGGSGFALALDTDCYLDNMAEKICDFFDDHKYFEGWVYNTSREFNKAQNPFNKTVFLRKMIDFKGMLKSSNCRNTFISQGLSRKELELCQDRDRLAILQQADCIGLYHYVQAFRNYKRDYLNTGTWLTNHVTKYTSQTQDMKQATSKQSIRSSSSSSNSSKERLDDSTQQTGYFPGLFGNISNSASSNEEKSDGSPQQASSFFGFWGN